MATLCLPSVNVLQTLDISNLNLMISSNYIDYKLRCFTDDWTRYETVCMEMTIKICQNFRSAEVRILHLKLEITNAQSNHDFSPLTLDIH